MIKQPQKILVKAPNWVGDALMATPVFNALGRAYPEAHIAVLAAPWVAPLLETHPAVKQVILYDPKHEHKSWGSRFKVFKSIKKQKFDLAILLPNSLHSALVAFLSGIPERAGYATDGRSVLLTKRIPLHANSKSIHQAEYYLELLQALGIEVLPEDKHLVLQPNTNDTLWAQDFLAQHNIDSAKTIIAIHPGAVKPGKRWPYKRFAEVGKYLIENHNAHILIFGSSDEKELLDNIKTLINSPHQTIVSGTTLTQVAALMKHCKLFVGNDSGLMHLATAVETPIVGIFGPGTPKTTAPYNQNLPYVVIIKEFECRPCRQRFFTECEPSVDGAPPCLDSITVEDVLNGVKSLLSGC